MVGLASKLRYLRDKAGFTLAGLGERARVSRGYLWELENRVGKAPSADILYRIALVFGVTVEWFYQTPGYCMRCASQPEQLHYLNAELPFVCDGCFDDGRRLLAEQEEARRNWIERKGESNGKTQEGTTGPE